MIAGALPIVAEEHTAVGWDLRTRAAAQRAATSAQAAAELAVPQEQQAHTVAVAGLANQQDTAAYQLRVELRTA